MVDCRLPPTPRNGLVSVFPNTECNSVATYSCDSGYDLVGSNSRMCQTNAEWSMETPIAICRGNLFNNQFNIESLFLLQLLTVVHYLILWMEQLTHLLELLSWKWPPTVATVGTFVLDLKPGAAVQTGNGQKQNLLVHVSKISLFSILNGNLCMHI